MAAITFFRMLCSVCFAIVTPICCRPYLDFVKCIIFCLYIPQHFYVFVTSLAISHKDLVNNVKNNHITNEKNIFFQEFYTLTGKMSRSEKHGSETVIYEIHEIFQAEWSISETKKIPSLLCVKIIMLVSAQNLSSKKLNWALYLRFKLTLSMALEYISKTMKENICNRQS